MTSSRVDLPPFASCDAAERPVGTSSPVVSPRIAVASLLAALSAPALALHRLIVAESARFPKLVAVVTEEAGSEDAVKLIAGLLEREARAEQFALDAPIFAAQLFLSMVISWPQRRAVVLGRPMPPAEVDAWARDVVNLFLNGCRGRLPAKR